MDTPQSQPADKDPISGHWQQAGIVSLIGATAADFLQGYVTCDTSRLVAEQALPMAICNLKGRVVASGWLLASPQGIDLLVHVSLVERVRAFLKPYVSFSKCTFADNPRGYVVVNSDSTGVALGSNLVVQVQVTIDTQEDCSEALNTCLIEQHFAFISEAVSELFLPQMLDLHTQGAVDFDKGCYLGQEIVARAQFRGAVKRHLVSFTDHTLPAVGAPRDNGGTVIAINRQGHGLASVKTG